MKRSDVLMICAVVYMAPQLSFTGAMIGFAICALGWVYFVAKGE